MVKQVGPKKKLRRGGGTRPLLLDIDGEKFFERTRTRKREKEGKKKKQNEKGNEGKKKVTVPGGRRRQTQHGLAMTGANATSLANRRQKGLVHLAPEISQILRSKDRKRWDFMLAV